MTDAELIDAGVRSPGSPVAATDIVFYDGHCGLCHASVRFILRREKPTSALPLFAPLLGETFNRLVRPAIGCEVPDSLHVLTRDGRLLNRSRAVIHLARGLGGGWARLAAVSSWCPTVVLDLIYRLVAAMRKRLLKPPASTCPMAGSEHRHRFLP